MRCFGKTDKGLKRKTNQDFFRIFMCKTYALAVVCDGMGGAKGGSTASRTAAVEFMKSVKNSLSTSDMKRITSGDIERILVNSLNKANAAVYEKAGTSESLDGMGTTLVAFVYCRGKTLVINTGDSRLYAFRNGKATQITKDHSFVQYLVYNGKISEAEAENHPQKNIILKVVGVNEGAECDVFTVDDYDYLLLCTDGLSNLVTGDEMTNIVTEEMDEETKVNILIDLANERGGADNITAVVFRRNDD